MLVRPGMRVMVKVLGRQDLHEHKTGQNGEYKNGPCFSRDIHDEQIADANRAVLVSVLLHTI